MLRTGLSQGLRKKLASSRRVSWIQKALRTSKQQRRGLQHLTKIPSAPLSQMGNHTVRTTNARTRSMATAPVPPPSKAPFEKVMAANRGEIAIRIMRAATELGSSTVSIFSHEDRYSPHRYKADQGFQVGEGLSPVAAYLSIDEIIRVAKEHGVNAIHPGYGFLSENPQFAEACKQNGITFIGPQPSQLEAFGNKTSARAIAIENNVPVVPGTEGAIAKFEDAADFVAQHGLPIIMKAAYGGGGRGMRVVRKEEELEDAFNRATSEAQAAFGNGAVFLEKYIERPRHIEVQVLGDSTGDVIHLFERDCSVQRRHQKVIEYAPSVNLAPETRERICEDAVRLAKAIKYENAGTVEFLVDEDGSHHFIEVNPRVQVEHTVTEEVTGVDIVQTQMRLASGESLKSMGLTQDKIELNGYAIQTRITTEDPTKNFQPDSGILSVYRGATGNGIRLDDGPGYSGALVTPHYDSLLVKVTAHSPSFSSSVAKLVRALREYRIRGVSTNKYFLINCLTHPEFSKGVTTRFIEENPEVLQVRSGAQNRGEKLLRFLGNIAVNGPDPSLGAVGSPPESIDPVVPQQPLPSSGSPTPRPLAMPMVNYDNQAPNHSQEKNGGGSSLRSVYKDQGPEAFARAVRARQGVLVTDTTWRDAHQSLLATRLRTRDILAVAPATAEALAPAYSLENWGGATFDVALRFLKECPWDRLIRMREAVPDIPFQMLLRGANGVGYTSYPDNAVHKFCEQAVHNGMDVFRVFDSLNYEENMKLGIDAVGSAGGIVEAAICYTGDVLAPRDGKYTMEYYLELARKFVEMGAHVLAIKDMAGLLKPNAAYELVSNLRKEFPSVPIHVHTHDTPGAGVASMLAAASAGADAVDAATDALSGTTSQPSIGALAHALRGTTLDTGLDPEKLAAINDYWEQARGLYAPFESGQKTGSADVYEHEMPGGQYTNLLYQSKQLGLGGKWPEIKKAYASANRLLGDIVKVTPSSKVVGDLAQFMVTNDLSEEEVREKASSLNFPQSVIEYFQGYLGIPHGGFPEPLRSRVLQGRTLPDGSSCFEGRPGAQMDPLDMEKIRKNLEEKYGPNNIRDVDVMSYVMYPKVFEEWRSHVDEYGDTSVVPTRQFAAPMKEGEEISFEIEKGKTLFIKLTNIGKADENGIREVIFDLNGEPRRVRVADKSAGGSDTAMKVVKADKSNPNHVPASMPGVVVEVKVKSGDTVKEGQTLVVMSAMKMETVVSAPRDGKVKSILTSVGENRQAGDLLVEMED